MSRFKRSAFRLALGGSNGAELIVGTGSPAASVVAHIGSLYARTDGGADTALYLKTSGNNASTGWVAVTTSAFVPASVTATGAITGALVEGPQAVQILTGNTQPLVLTAGKSFYPVISDSGARTGMTIPATGATGQIITIQGTDATKTCRFDDGAGNLKLSGNITLALNDTLTVIFDGTNWCEVTHSTNG